MQKDWYTERLAYRQSDMQTNRRANRQKCRQTTRNADKRQHTGRSDRQTAQTNRTDKPCRQNPTEKPDKLRKRKRKEENGCNFKEF